ncbi:MAG: tetratricopeptide repeat protein [Bacteroidia bacterium]|nr:tetratricopeptide repeat protein [Bacteroidia bacterium]
MKSGPFSHRNITKFYLILASLALVSCAKEKDTVLARYYHNTTSYFNGYYNANYLFAETITRLEDQYVYPNEGFMEVEYFGTEQEIKSFDADFETVIKKNDAVMFKHPNGNYIDDCRLLNGKAWFYRQNYTLAQKSFEYVLNEFPDSKLSPEAWFWMAKTFYKTGNNEMTRSILEERIINNDTVVIAEKMLDDLALFRTRLAIEAGDYEKAAYVLSEGIELITTRQRRARAQFLLGQLFTKLDNFTRALQQFELVEKYSLDYSLTFLAKINIARLYVVYQEGKDDDRTVQQYLTKLLKDEKNEEYQDQIYYEFALLEIKKGNLDAAIGLLQQSVKANVNNRRQKALSYFKIGQIYFYDLQKFAPAQAYYDSAATSINVEAPEYEEITNLASTLKEYITYVNTISYQDSMLWLAALPEAERDTIVQRAIRDDQRKKQEELDRELNQLSRQTQNDPLLNPMMVDQMNRRDRQTQNSAIWYFDNPAAVSSGRLSFQQQWGQRGNEDNWRRKNKKMLDVARPGDEGGLPQEEEKVDSSLVKTYGENFRFYQDIPLTSEAQDLSLIKIEEALYKLGQLYYQKLNEPDSAINTFEILLDRFEGSEYTLQARYALYKLYSDQKSPLAIIHKQIILNEFPQTVYAYLLQGLDPKLLKANEEDYQFAYNGLLNSYSAGEYETAIGFSTYLLSQSRFMEDPSIDLARLFFIRGMAYGYIGYTDSLESILTYTVTTFPEAGVSPRAQKTLDYLKNGPKATNAPAPERPAATSQASEGAISSEDERFRSFTDEVRSTDKVFILMYIDQNAVTKADATTLLSDFNQASFPAKRLKVFTFLYQQTHLLPYVSSFASVEEGKNYIQTIMNTEAGNRLITTTGGRVFYISHTNFKVAYGQKRMEDYLLYYDNVLEK